MTNVLHVFVSLFVCLLNKLLKNIPDEQLKANITIEAASAFP